MELAVQHFIGFGSYFKAVLLNIYHCIAGKIMKVAYCIVSNYPIAYPTV